MRCLGSSAMSCGRFPAYFLVGYLPVAVAVGRRHTGCMSVVSNDRAAWLAKHVLPHEPELRAWLGRRKALQLDVDDIVQEAYAVLAALESVAHIQNSRTYLFSTAHSVILQDFRRKRIVSIETVAEIDLLGVHIDEASPERCAAGHQELRQIAELIAGLPAKCREAFILRKVEGLPQREIARRMAISVNTVEKHVGKSIRILMDALRCGRGEAPADRRTAGYRRERGKHTDER